MGICILAWLAGAWADSTGLDSTELDSTELDNVVTLLELVLEADETTAVGCLEKLSQQAQSGQLGRAQLTSLRTRLDPALRPIWSGNADRPLAHAALVLAAQWGDDTATRRLRGIVWDQRADGTRRTSAIDALASLQDRDFLSRCERELVERSQPPAFQGRLLEALGRYEQPEIADAVLRVYSQLDGELQPKAIGVLTQRPAWSKRVLAALARGELTASVFNLNHMRSMLASRDPELAAEAERHFGKVRTERNPEREQLIVQMRQMLATTPGDANRGHAAFHRVCGQCHRIHGEGQEVGPDVTSNGRASFDQLLSNVFDPSLVIGPAYQAVTVVTQDGRVLTGLVAEDSAQRIVLKLQGGKVETIPRGDIDEVALSKLSLMSEGLEQQLKPQEIADLFAFLTLDKPPRDPSARPIPGTPLPPAPR